jgi:hypothetical protein
MPTITVGNARVLGPKEAGKPATLETSKAGESVTVPKGSKIVVTETAALPATEKAPAKPAVKVTEIVPSAPMVWEKQAEAVTANTGTVDTSIAKARIEVEERRPLLYVAIGLGVLGVVLRVVLKEWPSLGNGCLLGAVLAGVAWKVSAVPPWVVGVVVVAFGAIALGYKRAEWDKDGDGRPDFLQDKPKGESAVP